VSRTVVLSLTVVMLTVACEDRPAPTAPPTSPSMSVTAPVVKGASSICRTYSRALNRVNVLLARGAAARELQKKADAYNRLLAGACN